MIMFLIGSVKCGLDERDLRTKSGMRTKTGLLLVLKFSHTLLVERVVIQTRAETRWVMDKKTKQKPLNQMCTDFSSEEGLIPCLYLVAISIVVKMRGTVT